MKDHNMMSYEMYEDFKETMVKTIKTELSAQNSQPADNDLPQQLELLVQSEQERHRAIITQLAGRMEAIERSNAKTQAGMDNLQASIEQSKSRPNCRREFRNIEYRLTSNRKAYFGR